MPQLKLLLSLFTLSLFFVSCSTTKDQAKKLMEGGAYLQAREKWIHVLANSPSDEEALQLKYIAEKEYIGQELIKLREQNATGLYLLALDTLKDLQTKLKIWDHSIDANGASFLSKERQKLQSNYLQLLQQLQEKRMALKLHRLINLYGNLFSFQVSSQLTQYQKSSQSIGKQKCIELQQQIKGYFLYSFTEHYCHFFQQPIKSIKMVNPLYKDLLLQTTSSGNRQEYLQKFISQASKVLVQSPWYSAQSTKQMIMNLSLFASEQKRVVEQRGTYQYQKQIYYMALRDFPQVIKTPVKQQKIQCDNAGKCAPYSIYHDDIRTITQKKQVKESKYIMQELHFPQFEITRKLSIKASADFQVHKQKYVVIEQQEKLDAGVTHNMSRSDIGLTPHVLSLTSTSDWFGTESKEWGDKLHIELLRIWKQYYCGHSAQLEHWIACSKVSDEGPQQSWFSDHFDLLPSLVNTIINF